MTEAMTLPAAHSAGAAGVVQGGPAIQRIKQL
ncbi:MAG: hypothetical protein FD149_2689 [Rhodospirillaceae bacterium]|nr:MAG: hypothetical protein FD149_2689 [Rhodospirillaceae bacterium]